MSSSGYVRTHIKATLTIDAESVLNSHASKDMKVPAEKSSLRRIMAQGTNGEGHHRERALV